MLKNGANIDVIHLMAKESIYKSESHTKNIFNNLVTNLLRCTFVPQNHVKEIYVTSHHHRRRAWRL